jgi:hypothetical protein
MLFGIKGITHKKRGDAYKNEGIADKTFFGHFFQIYNKSEEITHKNLKKCKNIESWQKF